VEQTVRISDKQDGPRYQVTFTNSNGQVEKHHYYTRTAAVSLLNKLVLDCGRHDAKLRLLPKRKVTNV
jgi:hypothetical protein